MIPLTPSFLIAAATSLVRDPEEGATGCAAAAFVHHVGYMSHFQYGAERSSWPLPSTASCAALAQYASNEDVLREEPAPGDVFLLWHAPTATFEHTGIVARVRDAGVTPGGTPWVDCDTIEGNGGADDNRTGDAAMTGVVRRVRRFYPTATVGDRFIRWVDLDRRWMAGDPLQTAVRVA